MFTEKEKVEAIKSDIGDEEEEMGGLDDYEDEGLDFNEEEQQEEKVEAPSSKKDDKKDYKKRLIKFMIIIVAVVFIFIFLLLVLSFAGKGSYSYEKVEEIMKNAAESYFKDYPDNLPQDEDLTVEIDVANLVAAEKMKPLSEYIKNGESCSGRVQVTKSGDSYNYVPYLTCGDQYSTKFLTEEVTKDENLVDSGYGLYPIGEDYIFRGENVNNYVQLDQRLWRIVRVNADKTITLTLAELKGVGLKWDDRYNSQKGYDSGINNYTTSRMKDALEEIYNLTDTDDQNYMLSDKDKGRLVNYDLCYGKVSRNETVHNNSKECIQSLETKIGLLTLSDYMTASIDSGCTSPLNESCKNYNYLVDEDASFWLVTAETGNTYNVYGVSRGVVKVGAAYQLMRVRPVITLNSNAMIAKGKGTEKDPYVLK